MGMFKTLMTTLDEAWVKAKDQNPEPIALADPNVLLRVKSAHHTAGSDCVPPQAGSTGSPKQSQLCGQALGGAPLASA